MGEWRWGDEIFGLQERIIQEVNSMRAGDSRFVVRDRSAVPLSVRAKCYTGSRAHFYKHLQTGLLVTRLKASFPHPFNCCH
jgi:hypothetical protein